VYSPGNSTLLSQRIAAMMRGERRDCCFVYQSSYQDEKRWFQVRVTRFHSCQTLRLVLAHGDITEVKQAEVELHQLAQQLLQSQDKERRRIARELHDVTVQNVGAILLNLAKLQRMVHTLDGPVQKPLAKAPHWASKPSAAVG
jgi:two-component system NarL family sensor kinase